MTTHSTDTAFNDYPPLVYRYGSHSEDQWQGQDFDVEKLDRELNQLYPVINLVNQRLRAITDVVGDLSIENPQRQIDIVETGELDGDGTQGPYTLAQTIDPNVDFIGNVYVDGVRVFYDTDTPSSGDYAFTSSTITFQNAVTPSADTGNITYQIYLNIGGILESFQSLVDGLGAYLQGFPNQQGFYEALNTGDALDEVMKKLSDFIASVGPVTNLLLRDGSKTLTGNWVVNERDGVESGYNEQATGTIQITGSLLAGDYITIFDGITAGGQRFEFNTGGALSDPSAIAVFLTGNDEVDAGVLANAINNAASPLKITATYSAGALVSLEHVLSSEVGNRPIISATSNPAALTIVGMQGGTSGQFGPLESRFRIRNLPESAEKGDPIVHEQWLGIFNEIVNLGLLFLRLDGTSMMLNSLKMGDNKIVDMKRGTDPKDGVNLAQMEVRLAAIEDLFVPRNGRADGTLASQAELRGAFGFQWEDGADNWVAQTATQEASDPQDSAAVVRTFNGVPIPTADDQPANKLYTDSADTALRGRIEILESDTDTDDGHTLDVGTAGDVDIGGCSLGDATPVDIANGGEYHIDSDAVISDNGSPSNDTYVRVQGDLDITSILSGAGLVLDITGNLTVSGTLNFAGDVVIRAGGTVDISSATVGAGSLNIFSTGDMTISAAVTVIGDSRLRSSGSVSITGDIQQGDNFNAGYTTDGEFTGADGTLEITAGSTFTMLSNTIQYYRITIVSGGDMDLTNGTIRAVKYYATYLNPGAYGFPNGDTVDGIGRYAGTGGQTATGGVTSGGGGGTGGGNGGGDGTPPVGIGGAGTAQSPISRGYLLEASAGGDGIFSVDDPDFDVGQWGGGGILVLFAGGDIDASGAIFNASGSDPSRNDDGSVSGGGGGCVKATAVGTMTSGDARANGGIGTAGATSGNDAGGGGGGGVFLIAATFAGTQATSAAGGVTGNGPGDGVAGTAAVATLTSDQIICLRGLLDK